MKVNHVIALLLLFTFLRLDAQTLPFGVVKNTSVEGITEYELQNGLKVLIFPDPSKATITVNITYLVGSRHEGYGETGMAHLLEHLVFKGSTNHLNIPQELTEHGARPNGTTWYDRTNYFETFAASEANLKWALDLESDRMVNSFIAKKDLDSEMTVVRNEYESGENSPSSVLMKRVLSAAYAWHNYGNTTIGARADIENVPIDRLQAFYRNYYQPDNAILLVAGKIDEAKTIQLVSEYFSNIQKPTRVLIPTYTKEPTQDGENLITLKRVGELQALACAYHTAPGPHSDFAAISVLDEILTNEPAGRLYKALVETKKASSVWSFAPGLKEGGFLYIGADVRKENSLADAQETLTRTLENFTNEPPTKEEVERSKATILKYWNLAYNNAERVGLTMSEYIAQGDWRLFFLFRDKVENVSTEDVIAVAKKYLKPSNRTIGQFIPEGNPDRTDIPDAPPIKSLVEGYKGRAEISKGEEFDPSPDNIDKRNKTITAKNNIEYSFLKKENRGDAVTASINLRFGTPEKLVGKSTAAGFVSMMLKRGTKTMSRQQIEDKLNDLKSTVNIFGSSSGAGIRIESKNENLAAVMDLMADMVKNPVFTEEEFSKLKEEQLAGMEEQLVDPSALANNLMSRLTNPYPKTDVRYVMTMEEEIAEIKALKLEDVVAFYKDFYGATNASVSVVGDFDEKLVTEKLDMHLSNWKSSMPYQRITNPYKDVKGTNENIETPDKANATFVASMNMPIGDSHPDYAAFTIGNYMLGGGFLNSRLAVRIRQKEGLSYGVGSRFNASALDESGSFSAFAIYAPENRDKVQKAFMEELDKVRTTGFTKEEFDAAKAGWLQSRTVSRAQDNALVGKLAYNLYIDRNLQWDKALEDKISKMTVEDVNKVMAKYVDPSKMVYVKAGDFAKAIKEDKP